MGDHLAPRSEQVLARSGRLDLRYRIGAPAAFGFALSYGRSPRDNVVDVRLSLTTSSALANGCGPDPDPIFDDLPTSTSWSAKGSVARPSLARHAGVGAGAGPLPSLGP